MTATPAYTPAVTAALISAAKRNTRQLTGKFERYTADCTGRTAGTILRTPGDRLAIGATWSAELTDHGFAEGMRLWAAADPQGHAAAVAQREADAETARAECERIDAEHAATRAAQKAEYAAQEARHRAATAALSLEITTNPADMVSAVKAHASKPENYRAGWDTVVECYTDAEITEVLREAGATTTTAALETFATVASIWDERGRTAEMWSY